MDNVMIAVPTRGRVHFQTVQRLEDIRSFNPGMFPIEYVQGGLSVAQTRNRIVKRFIETGRDYLLMVDDDVLPPMSVLHNLFTVCPVEMGPVAIPVAMWHPETGKHMGVYDDQVRGIRPRGLEVGLNMVDVATPGCMGFHKSLWDKLPINPWRFSNTIEEENLSEDVLFCRDVRAKGIDVMAWWDGSYANHIKEIGLAQLA